MDNVLNILVCMDKQINKKINKSAREHINRRLNELARQDRRMIFIYDAPNRETMFIKYDPKEEKPYRSGLYDKVHDNIMNEWAFETLNQARSHRIYKMSFNDEADYITEWTARYDYKYNQYDGFFYFKDKRKYLKYLNVLDKDELKEELINIESYYRWLSYSYLQFKSAIVGEFLQNNVNAKNFKEKLIDIANIIRNWNGIIDIRAVKHFYDGIIAKEINRNHPDMHKEGYIRLIIMSFNELNLNPKDKIYSSHLYESCALCMSKIYDYTLSLLKYLFDFTYDSKAPVTYDFDSILGNRSTSPRNINKAIELYQIQMHFFFISYSESNKRF